MSDNFDGIVLDLNSHIIKGPFIYYVSKFLNFLDPLPPLVSMFLVLKISTNYHFLYVEMGFYGDISWESRCNIEILNI